MNFRYFGYDGQMSTRILTDPSGEVTDRYDSSASGRALNFDPALAATSLLYTGEAFVHQPAARCSFASKMVGSGDRAFQSAGLARRR